MHIHKIHSRVVASYTEDPSLPPSIIFPNHGLQILAVVLHIFGIAAVTWALARRTIGYNFLKLQTYREISWARLSVILVFLDSWAFVFTVGVLVSGTGLSYNRVTCMLGIYACIAMYAVSKVLIYAFLIEKVWIVWSQRSGAPPTSMKMRYKSPVWRICFILMFAYVFILILMIIGRIAEIRPTDGVCVIGLERFASLPLLTFDLFITFFLTGLFVYPLLTSSLISPKLRRVATRTLVSSAVALATSAINIAILTFLHGKELGWVCLTSCGSDVTINGLVLFWVTTGSSRTRPQTQVMGDVPYNLPVLPHDGESKKGVISSDHARGRAGYPAHLNRQRIDSEVSDSEIMTDPYDYLPRNEHVSRSMAPSPEDSEKIPALPLVPYPRPPIPPPVLPLAAASPARRRHSIHSQSRPASARASLRSTSNPDSTYGVVMLRSNPQRPNMPTTQSTKTILRDVSGGSMRGNVRTIFKGIGDAFGIGPSSSAAKAEAAQTMSVQVTTTTEWNVPSLEKASKSTGSIASATVHGDDLGEIPDEKTSLADPSGRTPYV